MLLTIHCSRCTIPDSQAAIRNCKIKRCTLIHFPLRPHSAPMSANNALDNRKPNACSFKFLNTMQPLKDTEQFIDILHIKTDTVVFDIVEVFIGFNPAVHFNNSILFASCEFYGVGQKISKNLANHRTVATSDRKCVNLKLYHSLRSIGFELIEYSYCQSAHVNF